MSIRLVATIVQKSYMNLSLEEIQRMVTQVMSSVNQVSATILQKRLHDSVTGGDSQDDETSDE